MQPLRNIMGEERWLKPLINHAVVLRQIRLNWHDVMGTLSPHFTPDYLYQSDLVITANNPIWAAEIRYFTPMIVSKLQAFDPGITGLKVRMASPRRDSVRAHSGVSVAKGSLSDVIRQDIESKLAKGLSWCCQCQSVLTDEGACVFCRCQPLSPGLDSPL